MCTVLLPPGGNPIAVDKYTKWELRSFGILRDVEQYFRTDVSGQIIEPIFKGQTVQKECQEQLGKQFI